MSLPSRFATNEASIPADIPYLGSQGSGVGSENLDPHLVEHWRQKIAAAAGGTLKIGIAWAGKPIHQNDRNRSMPLENFAPLASSACTFFSLQKGRADAPALAPPPGLRLIDFSSEWVDFCDTAALAANLDLVISVDTSAVHLAGALARPVWTLLPFNPDWRWLLNRDDSPWYPTMRVFRQQSPGNWGEMMERVKQALMRFVAERGP